MIRVMTNREETHTDGPPADDQRSGAKPDAGATAEDRAAAADLRVAAFALAGLARRKAEDLATRPDGADDAAEIRSLNVLSLSLGRLVEMQHRYEGKLPAGGSSDDLKRELKRLLDLDDAEIRAVLGALAASGKSESDREGAARMGSAPLGGDKS